MNPLPFRHPDEDRFYARSWAASMLFHGLVVTAAIAGLSDLKLAPEPEPFKWNVAIVDQPVQKEVETPSETKQFEPASTSPQPAPAQPVTETVQEVQTVQQVVQEVREVKQVVTTESSTQIVSRAVETLQTVATAAEAETHTVLETPSPASTVETIRAVSSEPTTQAVPDSSSTISSTHAETVVKADAPMMTAAVEQAVTKPAAVKEVAIRAGPKVKADYGWLAELLWKEVERLKRYPHLARMNRWEGKVVLRAVIREDGQLLDLEVTESSGHSILDLDAMELMKQASPLKLKHPLEHHQVVVHVPISYKIY